ncbi:MAG: hypothetical protein HY769_05595 [Candidatus Stahlbacteria bacterium]|nr:hypothetical protein [Candidatus Stahlbacteria bacterium]
MKKVVSFIGLIVFAGILRADNLIFNPGFDMTPWDTGWTFFTNYAIAEGDTGIYHSLPRSCKLNAHAFFSQILPSVDVQQEINPSTCCTCKIYFKCKVGYMEFYGWATASIAVKLNNQWVDVEYIDTTKQGAKTYFIKLNAKAYI